MIDPPRPVPAGQRPAREHPQQKWRTMAPPPGSEPHPDIDERLRHALWLAGCCLPLAALAFATRPGSIIADTKIDMALDPAGFLDRALHLWDPAQFGQLQNQAVGYFFPMGPFFLLGKLIALPRGSVQRLWLTAVFIAAFLGTVRLGTRLGIGTPGDADRGRLRLCTVAERAEPDGHQLERVPARRYAAVDPASRSSGCCGRAQDLEPSGSELRAVAQSAVAVALVQRDQRRGGARGAAPAGHLLLTGQRPGRDGGSWPGGCRSAALASLWWTIPLLLLGKYGVSILPYSESAAVTTSVTSLSNTLRGTEDWTTYLVGQRVALVAGRLPDLHHRAADPPDRPGGRRSAWPGWLSRRMPERRFLLCALLAGVFIIVPGLRQRPGQSAGRTSLDHLINGPLAPLRNLRKFDPLVRLPVALGLAQLLASPAFPARPGGSCPAGRGRAGQVLAVPAAAAGLSAAGDFPAVPPYWVAAANWLNKHAGTRPCWRCQAPASASTSGAGLWMTCWRRCSPATGPALSWPRSARSATPG